MSKCICGADVPCPVICGKHNYVGHGYPCEPCQQAWREANPRTAAVIGSGRKAAVDAARKADREARDD